jgi:hypothetical protein
MGSLRIVGSPLPEKMFLPFGLSGFQIHLLKKDLSVRTNIVHLAVIVKEQIRINAGERKLYRVRPLSGRVFCGDIKVPVVVPVDICHNHIEKSIVISYTWCINIQAIGSTGGQKKLTASVQNVTDLFPIHKIPAVIYGDAGEIFKRACYQVKVLPHPANAGVRMKTR